jgi:hypothetical protein
MYAFIRSFTRLVTVFNTYIGKGVALRSTSILRHPQLWHQFCTCTTLFRSYLASETFVNKIAKATLRSVQILMHWDADAASLTKITS